MENKCRFIKKSNPCNCKQFVRFALSRGQISKDSMMLYRPAFTEARENISRLKMLRDIYEDIYPGHADESFAKRVKQGIRNKEWAILS